MKNIETISSPATADTVRNFGRGVQWKPDGIEVEATGGDAEDLIAGHEWVPEEGGLRCGSFITNAGAKTVSLSAIRLKFSLITETPFETNYVQSWAMNGGTGLVKACEGISSSGVMGWNNSRESLAVVGGFLDHSTENTRVETVRIGEQHCEVLATVSREGLPLAPGEMLAVSPFWLRTGNSLSMLLGEYAAAVASTMGVRKRKPAESGWCSWYYFYGKETFEDVVACAGELSRSPMASLLRTIQIDDGWNRRLADNPPDAWGDWEAHCEKFPSGMAAAVRRIHEMGFRAGLWLAPFAIARKSRFFEEHPDWLVGQRDSKSGEWTPAPSADNPDIFQLDCTHPGALDWIRETFRRVFQEWEFDYVKIDFLHFGAQKGIRHDSSATSIGAYRRGLQAINEVAGEDKFILGCGAPLLASVGLVDGMRVGPDVGGRWAFDAGLSDWPVGNCSVRAAAIPSFWSQWMHGVWWQNDPDCLVARLTPPPYEREFFDRVEKDMALKTLSCRATPLGLSDEEAGVWVRFVWMTGGMALLSEVWSGLSGERQEMLLKGFAHHGRQVSMLNWFVEEDAVALIAGGEPLLVGFFNFGDTPSLPVIHAKKLGLSGRWSLRERWSGELLEGEGCTVVFPELPPHAGRVWEKVL